MNQPNSLKEFLNKDVNGQCSRHLRIQIEAYDANLRSKIQQGVSPGEYQRIQRLRQVTGEALGVIERFWQFHHGNRRG